MSGPDSTSEPAVAVKAGDVLAEKYEVERVLGIGGMGIVVSARHAQLKQRVALKLLLPALATNGEVVARFLREAQSASTIRSEHVVRVTDVGRLANGAPFMVMEYLEGRDLSTLLQERGRLPVAQAVDYVLQAMEALAEAHQAGIVHRDLKPANLFLSERADGSPLIKVLDFGISKLTSTDASANSKSLTRTAGLMGSPLYMSPEQIRSSKSVDARADVWSLGVILYELLAGRPPFWGEEMNGVLAAIVADDPVPLGEAVIGIPKGLEAVVMRCLAKKPEARFQNVGELARELAPFGSGDAALSLARVVGVTHRNQGPSSLAASQGAIVVASAGTAGAWTQRSDPEPHASRRLTRGALVLAGVGLAAAALFAIKGRGPVEVGSAAATAVAPPPVPRIVPEPRHEPSPPVLPAQPVVAPSAVAAPTTAVASTVPTAARPPRRVPAATGTTAPRPAKPAKKAARPPDVGDMIDERR